MGRYIADRVRRLIRRAQNRWAGESVSVVTTEGKRIRIDALRRQSTVSDTDLAGARSVAELADFVIAKQSWKELFCDGGSDPFSAGALIVTNAGNHDVFWRPIQPVIPDQWTPYGYAIKVTAMRVKRDNNDSVQL